MLSQTQSNFTNNTTAGAVNAKLISGFGILFVTILLIFAPLLLCRYFSSVFTSHFQRRRELFSHALSAFNCFASGIFLGTAYLHIYVEADENVQNGLEEKKINTEFPLNNLVVLLGILFILAVEETATFIQEKNKTSYAESESTPLIISRDPVSGSESNQSSPDRLDVRDEHGHSQIVMQSTLQSVLLCLAISVHSIFEGLSIGLANTPESVYNLVVAITFHKVVVTITMGINFGNSNGRVCTVIILCLIYSIANPLGVLIGSLVSDVVGDNLPIGILQGISCGTFIYVAVFEMLPAELRKPNRIRTLYIFSALVGILVVVLLTLFGPHHHHHGDEDHHH